MQAEIKPDNDVSVNLPELNVIHTRIRLRIQGMPWHVYNKLKDMPTCEFTNVIEPDQPSRFRLKSPEDRKLAVDVDVSYVFTKTDKQVADAARRGFNTGYVVFTDLFKENQEEHQALLLALDPFFENNILMQKHRVLSEADRPSFFDHSNMQFAMYSNNPMLTTKCVVIDVKHTRFTETAKASVLKILRQRYSEGKRAAEIKLGQHAMLLYSIECSIASLKRLTQEDMRNGNPEITQHTQELGALIVKQAKSETELKRIEAETSAAYQQDELETVYLLHLELK